MLPIAKRTKEIGIEWTKLSLGTILIVAAIWIRPGNADSFVIVAKEHGLISVNLDTRETTRLFNYEIMPNALDACEEETGDFSLFWSDTAKKAVYTGRLQNGELKNITMLAQAKVGSVEGVAVDWVARLVYWVASAAGTIEVAMLNGKQRAPLIVGLDRPHALALDPHHRLLFWSDISGAGPRIERSSLNGQQRTVIVSLGPSSNAGWINSIALDRIQKRIVWVDAKSDSIHIATYDGDDERILVPHHTLLQHAFGIALLNSTLIWTDSSGSSASSVVMVDPKNQSSPDTLYHSYSNLYGLSVISSGLQRKESNGCDAGSDPCSHLCLLAEGHEPSCHCPYGMLPDNGKANSCQTQNFTLLVALSDSQSKDAVMVLSQSVQDPSWPLASPVGLKDSQMDAVLVDWRLGSVMWLDAATQSIHWRPRGKNSSYERMPISKVSAMAVDPATNKVYAASSELASVIVECDTSSCTPLIQGLENIVEVAASPRLLVWMYLSDGQTYIEGMHMESRERFGVASSYMNMSCLSVDPVTHDILWVDESSNVLQRKPIFAGLMREFSLPLKHLPVRAISALNSSIYVAYNESVWVMNARSGWQKSFVPWNKAHVTTMKLVQLQSVEDAERTTTMADGVLQSPSPLVQENVTTRWKCSRACYNGGYCVVTSTEDEVCWCPPTYWGSRCEMDACGCERGQCVLRNRQLMCQCPLGYTGLRCELEVCADYCGRGVCVRDRDHQWCRCQRGWVGHRCTDSENAATSLCVQVCENGGTCVGVDRCRCTENFTGRRCEIAINGAVCQDSSSSSVKVEVVITCVMVGFSLLAVVLFLWCRHRYRHRDTFAPSSFLRCKSRHKEIKNGKHPSLLSLVFCPERCQTDDDNNILLRSCSSATDTGV